MIWNLNHTGKWRTLGHLEPVEGLVWFVPAMNSEINKLAWPSAWIFLRWAEGKQKKITHRSAASPNILRAVGHWSMLISHSFYASLRIARFPFTRSESDLFIMLKVTIFHANPIHIVHFSTNASNHIISKTQLMSPESSLTAFHPKNK